MRSTYSCRRKKEKERGEKNTEGYKKEKKQEK
jgi:hypothetical protein